MSLNICRPLLLLKDFEKGLYYFFSCLVELLSDAVWSWTSVSWEVFDDQIDLFTSDQSVPTFFLHGLVGRNLSISSRLCSVLASTCS